MKSLIAIKTRYGAAAEVAHEITSILRVETGQKLKSGQKSRRNICFTLAHFLTYKREET